MANSRITTTGDGSTIQFAINFTLGYLAQEHVTCQVGGEVDGFGDPSYRTLTWITSSLVEVGGTTPADGEEIIFERTVPKDELWHNYSDGVAIEDTHLDESNTQLMHCVHEIIDGRLATLSEDLDMGGFKLTNVAQGVADTDGVNVIQVANMIAAAAGLGGSFPASGITYSNTTSGLTATNIQAAIDELDSTLDTTNTAVALNTAKITDNRTATRVALFKTLI